MVLYFSEVVVVVAVSSEMGDVAALMKELLSTGSFLTSGTYVFLCLPVRTAVCQLLLWL